MKPSPRQEIAKPTCESPLPPAVLNRGQAALTGFDGRLIDSRQLDLFVHELKISKDRMRNAQVL